MSKASLAQRNGHADSKKAQQKVDSGSELDDLIRKAQLEAGVKRREVPGLQAPAPTATAVTPEALFGNWTDTYGNTVCVYSMDAFNAQLVATLSRPPRHDINLPIYSVSMGCGWHCGDAALVERSDTQLMWMFPNGNVSTWTRKGGANRP